MKGQLNTISHRQKYTISTFVDQTHIHTFKVTLPSLKYSILMAVGHLFINRYISHRLLVWATCISTDLYAVSVFAHLGCINCIYNLVTLVRESETLF